MFTSFNALIRLNWGAYIDFNGTNIGQEEAIADDFGISMDCNMGGGGIKILLRSENFWEKKIRCTLYKI